MTSLERIAALEAKIARLESSTQTIPPSSIPTVRHRLAITVAGPASYPTTGSKFYISFLDGAHVRTVDDADPGTFAARQAVSSTICFNLSKTLPAIGTLLNVFEWGGYWWCQTSEPGPTTFIRINDGTVAPCSEVNASGQCVFPANLVTYHGGASDACGTWTVGASVYATATNQCEGVNKAREGDVYPAHIVSDAFTPPSDPTLPLYAFRATSKPTQSIVKITSTGGDSCDNLDESNYCHWEGKIVSYHGGVMDACGTFTEGEDVYVHAINRCGNLRAKIGDQFSAFLLVDDFDPGGIGSDLRPLYGIRVQIPDQTVKIGKTVSQIDPGDFGPINIWRRATVGADPTITSPLEQETAYLDWMHNSEQVSADKQVLITWFEDEDIWRITGAECET